MKNRLAALLLAAALGIGMLTGCGAGGSKAESAADSAVSAAEEATESAASEVAESAASEVAESAASEVAESAASEIAESVESEVAESMASEAEETAETVSAEADSSAAAAIEDGTYLAEFNTDSSMFHANETMDGKGVLTMADGKMTIHVSLASKKIVNLFPGLAADAEKDGAELLEPTEDEVTYSDGMTETVYGFDIPVPALDEEFDCALIGTKGKWYDHKVVVSNPEPYTAE